MNEEEILRRLKIAYESFTKSNISEYQTAMREAKALIDALPERGSLYGEWLLLTYLPNMWDLDKICDIFKEALKYIQGYSRIIPRRSQIFGDSCSPLASLNQVPGHADENGVKLHEAVELYCKLTGGSIRRMPAIGRSWRRTGATSRRRGRRLSPYSRRPYIWDRR